MSDERCTREKDGIVHFVAGTGGHVLSMVEDDQKTWHEEAVNDYGFARFDLDDELLRCRFIRSTDGSVADDFTMRAKVQRDEACRHRLQQGVEGRAAGRGQQGAAVSTAMQR